MDAFAGGMTARGPTLGADRETWTGSLHIVDLPSDDAAREFVEREPYNRAGLFEAHTIRRFTNLLGRTMWEYAPDSGDPRFLVIAQRAVDLAGVPLIVHGELFDGETPAGLALALQAPSPAALAELGPDLEIHDWEFGGRR
jgi:hypothetical protein